MPPHQPVPMMPTLILRMSLPQNCGAIAVAASLLNARTADKPGLRPARPAKPGRMRHFAHLALFAQIDHNQFATQDATSYPIDKSAQPPVKLARSARAHGGE